MGRTLQIICGAVLTLAVLGFGLWCLLIFEPAVPHNADQPTSQPNAQYEAGGAECRSERLQRMPASKREAQETDCAQKREDHRKEQADLVQQTRAANAGQILVSLTKDQTGIALLQAVLSLVGVIATALAAWAAVVAANAARASVADARNDAAQQADRFGWQLKAAQDAASAAEHGARATRRMAIQMARQVEVSEKTAERQLRAYIHVGSLIVTGIRVGEIPTGQFITKNGGQTPALAVITRMAFFTDKDPLKTKIHSLHGIPVSSRATFGAGQEGPMRLSDGGEPLTEAQIKALEAGSWGYGIVIYISYRDVFGRFRRTIGRGHVRGEKVIDGKLHLNVAHKHVRST